MGRQYWISYSLKTSKSAIYFVQLLTFQKALQSSDQFPVMKLKTNVQDLQSNHTVV